MLYIITSEPFPYGMAATNRIKCYAKALLLGGKTVKVICYHRSEIYGRPIQNTVVDGNEDGIEFQYVGKTTRRAKNRIIRHIIDQFDKFRCLLFLLNHIEREDIIIVYSHDKFAKSITKVTHLKGARAIIDFCEYPYATLTITDRTKRQALRYLKHFISSLDGAICISKPLLELANTYMPDGEHVVVPILVDEKAYDGMPSAGVDVNYSYIFHSGTLLDQKDGICDVLNAFFKALPYIPEDVKYLFTGSLSMSPDKDKISRLIEKLNLQNRIEFLGYLTKGQMTSYMRGASCFIINKKANLQNQYCFPTKEGEYLLSGNPVLISNYGESVSYLDSNSAYIFNHDDVDSLSSAIVDVFSHPKEAKAIGGRGRNVCLKNFSIARNSIVLSNYIDNMSSNRG